MMKNYYDMSYTENNMQFQTMIFFKQNGVIKSFLIEVLHDHFKVLYFYLNEGDKVRECYSCMKLMVEANLYVGFFTIIFFKHFLLKQIY